MSNESGLCYCGCGEPVRDRRQFFIVTHDQQAEARVIREQYGTIADFVVAHGYGPHGGQSEGQQSERRRLRR